MNRKVALTTVLCAAMLFGLGACADDSTTTPSPSPTESPKFSTPPVPVPTTPPSRIPSDIEQAVAVRAVVQEYVENTLKEQFAGWCDETSQETDIGKFCVSRPERDGIYMVVTIGPTFSEYIEQIVLVNSDVVDNTGEWTIVRTSPVVYP